MKLSNDKDHLVTDNQKLVHYVVQKKLGIKPNSSEYDDMVSAGIIGLVKAAITFEPEKQFKFATYAVKCITNEIFMYYRNIAKHKNDISIDEVIKNDEKGNDLTLKDIIEAPDSDFVGKIASKEDFIKVISIILNHLKGKHRLTMLYVIGNAIQKDIATKMGFSQSYASRVKIQAICEIQEAISNHIQYREVFSMSIKGDEYRITFSTKDVSQFNKIFATFLQNLKYDENLPDFKINRNNDRIIIQVPAHTDSFYFIAQLIQEIDNFSMTFVSNKNKLS